MATSTAKDMTQGGMGGPPVVVPCWNGPSLGVNPGMARLEIEMQVEFNNGMWWAMPYWLSDRLVEAMRCVLGAFGREQTMEQ